MESRKCSERLREHKICAKMGAGAPDCQRAGSHLLFQEKTYQLFTPFPIGLIPHREIDPCLFVHDALIVAECVKSGLAVVSAHAAFPKAAETHLRGGKVDDGVIDAAAAEAAARGHFPCSLFVRGEDVQRQRMRHGVDPPDDFVQTVEYQDWHDGTEDLFLHDSVGEGHIIHDRGLDAQSAAV